MHIQSPPHTTSLSWIMARPSSAPPAFTLASSSAASPRPSATAPTAEELTREKQRLWSVPPKSCSPTMPKMAKKKRQRRKTLASEGMAEMSDETSTWLGVGVGVRLGAWRR